MDPALSLSPISHDTDPLSKGAIVRHHRAALSKCSEDLPRIKTETSDLAEGPGHSSFICCAMSLGSVLDD